MNEKETMHSGPPQTNQLRRQAERRLRDKNAANPPMVEYFFGEADPLLERMRTALRKGNATEMGNAAHRLKGTACYLGAPDTMDATQRVEQAGKSGNLPGAAEMIQELEQHIESLKKALAPYRTVKT